MKTKCIELLSTPEMKIQRNYGIVLPYGTKSEMRTWDIVELEYEKLGKVQLCWKRLRSL